MALDTNRPFQKVRQTMALDTNRPFQKVRQTTVDLRKRGGTSPAELAQAYDVRMVATRPNGTEHGLVEVSPEACTRCGTRLLRPYYSGCGSRVEPGHRSWVCTGCGLEHIDSDCDCDPADWPGTVRWPQPVATQGK